MRLKKWERVRYNPNPLVEVVAQVRFPRVLELDDQLPSVFQRAIQEDYPFLEIQEDAISVTIGQGKNTLLSNELPKSTVYHFVSLDRSWRISLCSEFFALTCDKYEQWEGFRQRMMTALSEIQNLYLIVIITRIGLRYRDLIIREDVGMQGVPWRELISPLLLGITIADGLSDDGEVAESDVLAAQSHIGLLLDNCQLNLRHGLAHREPNRESAYLIDADYFVDNQVTRFNLDDIGLQLDKFHANAGSIFRGCIQQRLHDALNPTPIS